MREIEPLVIGDLIVQKPVIQGGMGVGISLHRLAGAVAKAGGIGLISAAQIGFTEPDFAENPEEANARAIHKELKLAREIAPEGVIGFNIMVASKHYDRWVKEAVKAGADIIVSGAGLPVSLPEYVKEAYEEMGREPARRVKIAPIVSTAKSANVICKLWDRKYHMVPDLVVIEGPLAGGHLGFALEQLAAYGADTQDVPSTYKRDDYDQEIKAILKVVAGFGEKYGVKIPVVVAGGIYTHEDLLHQLELGADGVQVATRFVTTKECDAPEAYKEAYIKSKKEDIVIIKSPVGMPGRAIFNPFMAQVKDGNRPPILKCYRCLEHCNMAKIPYCITQALVNAAVGDEDHALLFCGSNAYRADGISTVDEVMDALINGEKYLE